MDAAPQPVPYRRIGTILLERGLITATQLEQALSEQQETGRPLGEVCVDRFGLDRLSLADALAEQWADMQPAMAAAHLDPDSDGARDEAEPGEDDLHALLAEAQAARDELTLKTDELGRRLALLETLVIGVTDALAELRQADPPAAPARATRSRAKRPPAAARSNAAAA